MQRRSRGLERSRKPGGEGRELGRRGQGYGEEKCGIFLTGKSSQYGVDKRERDG